MTDPNKAAVTESNASLLTRVASDTYKDEVGNVHLHRDDFERLRKLAEERVMIEEHRLSPTRTFSKEWRVEYREHVAIDADLSTALRGVIAKIGEGNG